MPPKNVTKKKPKSKENTKAVANLPASPVDKSKKAPAGKNGKNGKNGKKGKGKDAKVAPAPQKEEDKQPKAEEVEEKQPEPETRLTEIEEILLPDDPHSATMDSILQEIANEAVNGVVSSVVGLIKKGELQQHAPTRAWGSSNTDKEKRERILAHKRYNRIQRLLIQAENGQVDAQKELMKINQQLDKDHLSGVSAEDIILEDLAALIKAKEDRKKELDFKRRLKEQKKREQRKAAKRRERLQRETEEQMFRMRQLEEKFLERSKKDAEEKERKKAEKEAERKKEKQMQREMRAKVSKRLGTVPLYRKMERQYEKNVRIPELERRKKYLAQVRNDMRNPHYIEIAEHETHMRQWEVAERNRLAELTIPKNEIPASYISKTYKEVKKRDMEANQRHQLAQERKKKAAEKKQKFAQKVKKEHKPQVDLEKKAQMELLSTNVEKQRAQAMRQRGDELLKQVAGDYLHTGMESAINDPDVAKIKRKKKKTKEPKEVKHKTDYLQELKAQRKARPAKKKKVQLTPEEMAELARNKELDAEARLGGRLDVDTAAEVSEMYIDVIQTKLRMLEQPEVY